MNNNLLLSLSLTATILLGSMLPVDSAPAAPVHLRAVYSEKSLDIQWDSVPGAIGYNVYTAETAKATPAQRRKVNRQMITSGTRFAYIWDLSDDGTRVRAIKGVEHHLSVTALTLSGLDSADTIESPFSTEVDNCYFEGYRNITTARAIEGLMVRKQTTALLPIETKVNRKQEFIRFMAGPGQQLFELVKKTFDPRQVGACSPITTILVRLMHESGVEAVKVEGTFITEYHAFAVVNIDKVEYVLDFTADQFVPGVAPVLIPRDRCFIGTQGRLTSAGLPIYQAARIYNASQVNLSARTESDPYWEIYNSLSTAKQMQRDTSAAGTQPPQSVPPVDSLD